MHLRSLTLRGFKSFPDRTRLEFGPGVSVIVGPNGCGKSNITDAVLWALGEQSAAAVRGQSMQDVIFGGGHGVSARSSAEVEVVLDNADAAVDLPWSELSIVRRLERSGDAEYRLNGARCRLADVLEVMSDTGLGREMHSVVSQGRVEAMVTSKPRDRRLLVEEAAGLGKHRRRRRQAQVKLERTQDNLDRALDVEREARTRLKPLKRQAEAAELHERLERQALEVRLELTREASRAAAAELEIAATAAARARQARDEAQGALREVAARRAAAESALSTRAQEREASSSRCFAARGAVERIAMRAEAASRTAGAVHDRIARRRLALAAIAEEETAAGPPSTGQVDVLEAELAELDASRADRLAVELEELEARRAELAAAVTAATTLVDERRAAVSAADAVAETARAARRDARAAADAARREAARIGAELAAANGFLRAHSGAPGGADAFGDLLTVEPGFEHALAAVLGPALRAAVADDVQAGRALLARAGRDGGSALVAPAGRVPVPASAVAEPLLTQAAPAPAAVGEPLFARGAPAPAAVGEPLLARVAAAPAAATLAAVLLADAVVVGSLDEVPTDFAGTAVTRDGEVWSAGRRELRVVPAGGADRVLAERNRRDALVEQTGTTAAAEHAALAAAEAADAAVAEGDAARDAADRAVREAVRAREEALEAERQVVRTMEARRRAPDEGPAAVRRAQAQAELAALRREGERMERERLARAARADREREGLEADEALAPQADRLVAALTGLGPLASAVVARLEVAHEADREEGERLAATLRACASEEAAVQERLRLRGDEFTAAEVAAQRARDREHDAARELAGVAGRLGVPVPVAAESAPLASADREDLARRLERVERRRTQLGPVNPLAQEEYAEAVAHVEELEGHRGDLEEALRELGTLIRDTDRRIREAFDETFAAAATNFEDVAGRLFPGGRGRLRLVRPDAAPRPVLGGEEPAAADGGTLPDGPEDDDELGVEIEITPAGKATKRLSLLSGGEKSLTALAFLFALFLAKPCPFYILDEVEAALDDQNIGRFLTLLESYADRAQFIVVTHQRRTMEAADALYGVSMAGDGVSRVISRRLPRERAAA